MTVAALILAGILAGSLLVIAVLLYLQSGNVSGVRGPGASFVARVCALWVVSTALFGGYFYALRISGVFDLTVDRMVCIVLLCGVAARLYLRRFTRGLDKSIDILLLVFLTLGAVSMSLHGFLASHAALAKPWFIYLEGYLLPFFAFFCAKYVLSGEADDICLLRGFFYLGLVIVVIALMEGVGLRDYVFLPYIADKTITLHLDRARGPFLNAAFTGLALCIGLAAGLMLTPLTRFPGRIFHCCLLALFVPAIYYTRTRSVYLAFCIIAVGALVAMRTTFPKWKVYALPLCLVAALLALNLGRFASQERTTGGLAQVREIAIRFELAHKSLNLIREWPFFGVGLAQFRSTATTSLDETEYQHNHLIGMAAELGLTGLAVYLGILVLLFTRLFRLLQQGGEDGFYTSNLLFLMGLVLLANLASNSFVEPSMHAFANVNFFLFAGMIDRLYNRQVLSRG